jgi:hypothetical protein
MGLEKDVPFQGVCDDFIGEVFKPINFQEASGRERDKRLASRLLIKG